MYSTLLVTAFAVGAPTLKEKPNPAENLVGLWELESAEGGKQQQAKKREGPLRYRFDKDTWVVLEGDKEVVGARQFTFDPKAKPATLDFKIEQGPAEVLGIYKIEGDKLTICKSFPGETRPTTFGVQPGSRDYLMVFRRVKTKE
jgi:uncharacterized protein (TIGR03067 family)